jgi:hypothetical protein
VQQEGELAAGVAFLLQGQGDVGVAGVDAGRPWRVAMVSWCPLPRTIASLRRWPNNGADLLFDALRPRGFCGHAATRPGTVSSGNSRRARADCAVT